MVVTTIEVANGTKLAKTEAVETPPMQQMLAIGVKKSLTHGEELTHHDCWCMTASGEDGPWSMLKLESTRGV
eukprot:scaffold130081_cov74-Cyclotella_meneghiniana.AAC.5